MVFIYILTKRSIFIAIRVLQMVLIFWKNPCLRLTHLMIGMKYFCRVTFIHKITTQNNILRSVNIAIDTKLQILWPIINTAVSCKGFICIKWAQTK